jgi:putative ABC transport system permease protein
MHGFWQQIQYAFRLFLKSPGLTVIAVLILGIGIGANAAIFSLLDAVLLNPLPYPKPDRLAEISLASQTNPFDGVDYPGYQDMASTQRTFDSLAVSYRDHLDLSINGEAERLAVDFVSPSLFKVTGKPIILGRSFTESEDIPRGPSVAVLSEKFWKSRFQADPEVIGKTIRLSEQTFEVIGVAPFQVDDWGLQKTDVYLTTNQLLSFAYPLDQRDQNFLRCIGRLKDGISIAQAQTDLDIIHSSLSVQYPTVNKGYRVVVRSLLDALVLDYSATLWILVAAVGCLLLISCANIATLLFARALERQKEIVVRATLGASRLRLVGQVLLETACLSALGAGCGLLIALWGIEMIKAFSPPDLQRAQEVGLNAKALLFVGGLTSLVALSSGLLPAWSLSKVNLANALKDDGGRGGTAGPERQRVQSYLVAAQVALACVLLVSAGLLIRSFRAAENIPLGFNPHQVLTADIFLTSVSYEFDGAKTRAFWDAALEKVRQLPGVADASLNDDLPFQHDLWEQTQSFTVVGQPEPGLGQEPLLIWHMVSPGYFRTLQIPILKGRDFDAHDKIDTPNVVIVDETLAQQCFRGQDPLGKEISVRTTEGIRTWKIVGVVPHVRHRSAGLRESSFQAYFPYAQNDYDAEVLVVRSRGNPASLATSVRQAVASVDPDVPVTTIETFDNLIDRVLSVRKTSMILVSLFAGVALFLSAIGLYGILAYSISQRTREIGIRIALGAPSAKIFAMVICQGFKLVGIGLMAGLGIALLLGRFLESVLYRVSGHDTTTMIFAILVLGMVAFVACLIPAIRAVRIDPVEAFRR